MMYVSLNKNNHKTHHVAEDHTPENAKKNDTTV